MVTPYFSPVSGRAVYLIFMENILTRVVPKCPAMFSYSILSENSSKVCIGYNKRFHKSLLWIFYRFRDLIRRTFKVYTTFALVAVDGAAKADK